MPRGTRVERRDAKVKKPTTKAAREKAAEEDLNSAFFACFNTPAGTKVVNYLRNKALVHVPAIGTPLGELSDHTGQRRIVSEMVIRITAGQKQ